MSVQHKCVWILLAAFAGCTGGPDTVPSGWDPKTTGTNASLRGLSAVDGDVAVIGGSSGTLMRTVDGGRTWQDIAPPGVAECDFRDVEAFDRDNILAMVAGQPARVYRTADGGATWRIVHEDPRPAAFFDAMAFVGSYGVLFGDAIDGQFGILQTADGGRTWWDRSSSMLPAPQEGEAAFAASGTCLAEVAQDAPVFSLATGGGPPRAIVFGPDTGVAGARYWQQPLPLQSGASSKGAFSIAWREGLGVSVGGDYQLPELAEGTATWTDDGGLTWHPAEARGFRSAVAWLGEGALVSVGSHGASYSLDGGRSWEAFGSVGFHSLSVGADGTVWASGGGGRVAKLRY